MGILGTAGVVLEDDEASGLILSTYRCHPYS